MKEYGGKAGNNPDIVCLGQAVIDCITRNRIPGAARPEASSAESIKLQPGGDAVNESIALTETGCSVAPAFAVGDDAAGGLLIRALETKGVNTSRIVRMGEAFETPVANIFVERDGSRSSISSQAVKLPGFRPSPDLIAGVKLVSLCSLFRAPLDDPEVLAELARTAKAQGSVVCADTKLPLFKQLALPEFREVLPYIDYIFPNEREAAFYSGEDDYEKMADVFLSYGVRNVVVKAGPEGCYAKNGSGFFHIPAVPVRVINTTGAGDYFVAGFIAALLGGASFRECCMAGAARAAEKIS